MMGVQQVVALGFWNGVDEVLPVIRKNTVRPILIKPADLLAAAQEDPAQDQTQHALLMNLANKKPDAVFYVLPHYNTLARVGANSPNLLANTIFYPVVAIGPLAAPLRHRVDSSEAPGYRVVIHSDEREGVGRLGSALAGRDFWEQRRDSWLTRQQLRNSFDWLLEHQPKRRVRGQILRGFRLLAVPA